MELNSFNTNPMGTPLRKIRESNDSIGGRRELADIKKEMLDTTRPELKKSYISKYHRDQNEMPKTKTEDNMVDLQRKRIESLRRIDRGL
ncbi:MAG: hypothetical protein PHO63_03910 [Bacilli bacterium]|nr:hypothetical protein [Bacilli bacterium]MDD4808571.1 hypothetical protein [Bacilli bacterium]